MYRTHTCHDLTAKNIGNDAVLSGWVHRRRDHGGLIFIDLRDRYGLTQIVFDPQINEEAWRQAEMVRPEFVVRVEGKVRSRGEDAINRRMHTGEIEIIASKLTILNKAQTPPFEIEQETEVNEELRLKYRYLDFRRDRLKNNIIMRHKIIKHIRDFLDQRGFLEIETPILIKGTPEGSREYIVPSRLHHGKFYVLPQSPQQLKQLLMVGGMDRYFQIARCFRDEDQRGDRQPEFTQMDMEMSFVTQEEIMQINEEMMMNLIKKLYPQKKLLFNSAPRLTWQEAMDKYGVDKPDLRFGLEFIDFTSDFAQSAFQVFASSVAAGGIIRAIQVEGGGAFTRKIIDDLTEVAKIYGAKGLAYISWPKGEEMKSPLLKFLSPAEIEMIKKKAKFKEGDIIFFGAGNFQTVGESLGAVRKELGTVLKLKDPNVLALCWVYNFPLYERSKETGALTCTHHPFTSPLPEHIHLLDTEPEKALGAQYDLVMNGNEIGGGTLRIHDPEVQSKIFNILGIPQAEAYRRFGHMLEAFTYGAPPHGGIAWGLDRVVMLLQDEPNIREVIAYPKDQKAKDLMLGAPDVMGEEELKELGIKIME
jgi:aspartyl-tRNA synthetase